MALAHFLEILATLLISVGVYYLLARLVKIIIRKDYMPDSLEQFFLGIVRWFVIICATIMLLCSFGIPLTRVLTATSAILMLVAIGFVAVWSVLSNMLCAFLLLTFPTFRFGDEVELREPDKEKGVRGTVVNLNLFHTTLQCSEEGSAESYLIRIPNTLFFQRVVYCYEKKDTRKLKLGNIDSSVPGQAPSTTDEA